MPILRTGETVYDRELARWDRPKNQFIEKEDGTREYGLNAAGYEPFPKMLHKARRLENGKVSCMDMDAIYAVDPVRQAQAEAFNRSCQLTVKDESELRRAQQDGWCGSTTEALAHHEALQQDIAKAAAETNFDLQRMSDKAKREHAALDAATSAPVTDVPAPPIPKVRKKPGPKPKLAAV